MTKASFAQPRELRNRPAFRRTSWVYEKPWQRQATCWHTGSPGIGICGCLEFLLYIGQFREGWRERVINDSTLWRSIWPSPHIATAARTLHADWLPEREVLAFPAFLVFPWAMLRVFPALPWCLDRGDHRPWFSQPHGTVCETSWWQA